MAINSLAVPCDRTSPKSHGSNSSKGSNLPTSRLMKINFATENSICSAINKNSKLMSPYLTGDSVQLLSRVTEKKFLHKKSSNVTSSFPLAATIYKANSDEFKALKNNNKKARKSVLTLPNDPAPIPQSCTVSDMNDSEYYNRDDETRKKLKKRTPANKKTRGLDRGKHFEFYDRDAKYCSQMNIHLNCSSTDMIKNFNGGMNRKSKMKSVDNSKIKSNGTNGEETVNPHDVWAVLRNINRFQFRPSPPMSEDSFITPKKKKKGTKRRANRKDMRVVKTCRTEEFAYISSFEVDSKSPRSFSQSSSFDRITVIDKQDEFGKICKEFEKRLTKTSNFVKGPFKNKDGKQVSSYRNNNNKTRNRMKSLPQNANKLKELTYYQTNVDNPCGDSSLVKNANDNKDLPANDSINELIYSGHSGSSKAAIQNDDVNNKDFRSKEVKTYSDESDQQIIGITKVVLSKGQNMVVHNKHESPKSQPRQTTTMPYNSVMPRLTQTDIKRRLARLKFPIVVLGKDELSSSFEVINQAPPQFDGLTEHIWPFMQEWQDKAINKPEKAIKSQTFDSISQKQKSIFDEMDVKVNKLPKTTNETVIPSKQSRTKDKQSGSRLKHSNKTKVDQKCTPSSPINIVNQAQSVKSKPILQLKDRMLKLLYKNSSMLNVPEEKSFHGRNSPTKIGSGNKNTSNNVGVSTDTNIKVNSRNVTRRPVVSPTKSNKVTPPEKRPWAKAKWASDFIDNVIKKIRNGVYYNRDNKLSNKNVIFESKEVDIQTIPCESDINALQSIPKKTLKKKCEPTLQIPGFDITLPALEIKTINMNEIAVKHCVTNIMVHFDVTVTQEPAACVKKSSTLIPLDVTESHTRIFKCKTSIMNAMLPAELCSILPKMIGDIMDSSKQLAHPPLAIDKTASHLSTISEIALCESPELMKYPVQPHIYMSSAIRKLLNGKYANVNASREKTHVKRISHSVIYDIRLLEELQSRLSRRHLFDCNVDLNGPISTIIRNGLNPLVQIKKTMNTCTALQLYQPSERRLVPAIKRFDLMNFVETMGTFNMNIALTRRAFASIIDNNLVCNTGTKSFNEQKVILTISKVKTGSPYNVLPSYRINIFNDLNDIAQSRCIEYKYASNNDTEKKTLQNHVAVSNNKIRRKGFVKLYKKCKSTSNISGERATTPLSKITNLDDFFAALGIAKFLSSVFDSQSGHKIMASITEMKNWTSEISSKQALLILLLTNKKDTTNLVRYMPVLLQGIAVNRITRANELDMEIEVIERENLNMLSQSQYEGISYLPASIENQDNLLEELCWIAKTTASDYQRPFDESSEKLLRSLLEKRKKLNPSYLRVMARYVGLGLLKTPTKKIF